MAKKFNMECAFSTRFSSSSKLINSSILVAACNYYHILKKKKSLIRQLRKFAQVFQQNFSQM